MTLLQTKPIDMRKEIIGILLFFLVVFILISLVSYHPGDPSFLKAGPAGPVKNLFGKTGGYVSGALIGLFGLGAFWLPILFLLASIHFFGENHGKTLWLIFGGGLLLVVTTGSLLALQQDSYVLFGNRFSAGGLVGIPFKVFLIRYLNTAGATILLAILWLIGFILTTGFSLMSFGGRTWQIVLKLGDRFQTVYLKHRERREKAAKRTERIKEQEKRPAPPIRIEKPTPKPKAKPIPKQEVFEFMRKSSGGFLLPTVNFLDDPEDRPASISEDNLRMQSKLLEKKLEDFGVKGHVAAVTPGPVITTFEYAPAPGVKINKIVGLSDDLALTLRATSIRIVAPIPGKAAIGIEIPNPERETVRFKEVVVSSMFEKAKSKLTLCLGKDIVGNPVVAELDKMPHLLIAGATGSGKSVALNTMICSFLYKSLPTDVKLIMVDPKRIELSMYDGIPHLITPVVTDVKKATNALYWAVREMERRYQLLSEHKARNIHQHNTKMLKAKPDEEGKPPEFLPYIVIIIDELADLMMVASRDVEVALTRLAQMARAAGIHLILATQRPSVDVLTGIIKANFPTRLSFQVSSKTDSRTIIDTNGAESLLGMGDMLFLPPGTGRLQRIHGAYISESEISRVMEFLKAQAKPDYLETVTETPPPMDGGLEEDADYDERYDDAVALVTQSGQASISMVQRHLRIGYNRAARIIETMEKEGVVGPADGAKPREVLVRHYDDLK
ncbi:MAG: DNA translocase FtsK [Desulfobacterales bacterium]|jgi:S-DNA-T family DNA segregation ATPase FtsK/SpoIIIE